MWRDRPVDKKLVLVVDDDRDVRESLSNLLAVEGYSVLEAANGQKALELLDSGSHFPRVILLDLAMPVMDGHRFLELRAAEPILRPIPVVVLSGNSRSVESLNGIDTYLRKPMDVERLLAIIRAASLRAPDRPRRGLAGSAARRRN
jgi:CheY-like chemotaxis protein